MEERTCQDWLDGKFGLNSSDIFFPNLKVENINIPEDMPEVYKRELRKKMKSVPKQKRTIRRTYKIGKSKVFPRISVLVSNKTIRNNITTKSQLLKQTDMQDVKKYLMKRGFIKVGTTAPNDVLRKMYEEAILMCGEVQNHNPDNLLYNYLKGDE